MGLFNKHNSLTELVLVETFLFFVFLDDFDGLINSDTNLACVADHKLFNLVLITQIVSSSFLSDSMNVHLFVQIVSTLGINEEFMGNILAVNVEHVSCELRVRHSFNLSLLLTPCLSLAGLTLGCVLSLAHLVGALAHLAGLSCLSMVHFNDKENSFSF